MIHQDNQSKAWSSEFGTTYTMRNTMTVDELNEMYLKQYGISRTGMDAEFLETLDKDASILEVGANIGNQLKLLQLAGFHNLCGIEVSEIAVKKAKENTSGIVILQGSADDLPFTDNSFDLVFTSGVLMHLNPDILQVAMQEMHRCSKHYIWGFEYFATKRTPIPYRGRADHLWKDNYYRLFLAAFPELETVKMKLYRYSTDKNIDCMYLLRKGK